MTSPHQPTGKNHFSRNVLVYVLCALLVLAAISLLVGWCVREKHLTTYSALINLSAGFAALFFATLVALAIARAKLKSAAVPILKLIQQLESEGRITQEAARKSVVAVVAVLSESNVSRAVKPDPNVSKDIKECPVCWLDVELNPKKRCMHCLLPDALWHSKELIEGAPPRVRAKT